LIAIGAKKIETRSWATGYRGPLAIHAGKSMLGFKDLIEELPDGSDGLPYPFGEVFSLYSNFRKCGELPLGAVVAT